MPFIQYANHPMFRGQLISMFIAGTGIFASLLSRKNANFPEFMGFLLYSLLISFLCRRWLKTGRKSFIVMNSYTKWYFLLAVLDVEANVIIIEAYKHTSITSVMLLDCFAIPFAMVLSYFLLNARYKTFHLVGGVVCMIGMGVSVISDVLHNPSPDTYSNPLLGDMLTILAASLYACSNVLQERLLIDVNRDEFLGMLGFFGFFLTSFQIFIFDYISMKEYQWTENPIAIVYILGFVSCLFFMYANTSLFLQENDAVIFNLSILTSDVYSVIFSYFVYGYMVSWLYFLAFTLSALGIFIYHSIQSPIQLPNKKHAQLPQNSSVSNSNMNINSGNDIGDHNNSSRGYDDANHYTNITNSVIIETNYNLMPFECDDVESSDCAVSFQPSQISAEQNTVEVANQETV